MSYKKSLDANHTIIVRDLQKVGVSVLDLAGAGNGILDLITHHYNKTVLIEIKYGDKAEMKRSQLELLANWTGYCGVARNFDEAARLAKDPVVFALTGGQKYRLQQFLIRWTGKRLHLPTFFEVIK